MLIVQSEPFNRSRLHTVIVAVITTNLDLARAPANVLLNTRMSKLPKDSVVNVTQVLTLDRTFLTEYVSTLPASVQSLVDNGLRLVLQL